MGAACAPLPLALSATRSQASPKPAAPPGGAVGSAATAAPEPVAVTSTAAATVAEVPNRFMSSHFRSRSSESTSQPAPQYRWTRPQVVPPGAPPRRAGNGSAAVSPNSWSQRPKSRGALRRTEARHLPGEFLLANQPSHRAAPLVHGQPSASRSLTQASARLCLSAAFTWTVPTSTSHQTVRSAHTAGSPSRRHRAASPSAPAGGGRPPARGVYPLMGSRTVPRVRRRACPARSRWRGGHAARPAWFPSRSPRRRTRRWNCRQPGSAVSA